MTSLALLGLLLPASPPQQSYALFHRPKKGDVAQYSIRILISNDKVDARISSEVQGTCLAVNADGSWEMESKMIEGEMSMNGNESKIEVSPPYITKYDKFGKTKPDDSIQKPITNVITLAYGFEPSKPMKLLDSWQSETDYGTMTIKLDSKDEKGRLKILVTGMMSKLMAPGNVQGTVFVNESDFALQSAEFEIKNAVFQAGQPAGNIRFTITRKKKTS